ncbi:MAG: hypothetical protein A3B23_00425 [Candidatus Colwellbacteria bacterium RIFCSPLOWO2_01_FULL_48_10]|uniref:Uncharacterized protein n=2 Tax=Bacteria candidate phyla TaxID=1783234 RepID=A0A1F5P2U3_9BACT|nr:MAG: hypothetical protein A2846_04650 [Candidatus Doudnabacteria bacterium RIFCSPHIGHO2_01_FULL_49_9]OGY59171.1 MAG: hypothetical protein A3B23_00425 [Candidatus Colwellbacteria bacterium RIFCSPLOWO2_01_FULL_48_10]
MRCVHGQLNTEVKRLTYFSQVMGITAGVVSLAGYIPYIFSTIKGKTEPSKSTWWILTLVGVMLWASYKASGGGDTLWVPIAYIAGPFVVAILSLFKGEKGWSVLDSVCVAGALVAAIVWWITGSSFLAFVICVLVDFIGVIPTIWKSYHRPWTESRFAWGFWFLGSVINIAGTVVWIPSRGLYLNWDVPTAIYLSYMHFFNGFIFLLLVFPQRVLFTSHSPTRKRPSVPPSRR